MTEWKIPLYKINHNKDDEIFVSKVIETSPRIIVECETVIFGKKQNPDIM